MTILFGVELMLAVTNYKPGTFLMGWDNIMPELNFFQALKTNIFGAWIEYRGVGLPDGMSHAANLVHTLFLWALSIVIPTSILRYVFTFSVHLIGGLGVYVLICRLFGNKNKTLPVIGALFYMLNLFTIQMFYTPLEAFSVHFAALPWLTYSLIQYLDDGTKQSLLLFAVVALLSTPQFFVPTFMLPIAILLGMISIARIRDWKRILAAAGTFLAINVFWLAPYLYNLPHDAPIIKSAKINEMSSDEAFQRNQAFGDIRDVLSMKGFMLDYEDVNTNGTPIFVMNTWRNYLATPVAESAVYVIAGLTVLGIASLLLHSRPYKSTLVGLFIAGGIAFVFLANNMPYVSIWFAEIRDKLPLFGEAYRFPFTKFSLLYSLVTSILIVVSVDTIPAFLARSNHVRASISSLLTVCIVIAISISAFPSFQGQFFYDGLRIRLPSDYMSLFTFMNTQDPNGRTAYFPQPSYWSWKHYSFGYVGSGFLWFGLQQPLLDQAFDPWNNVNENYYWEITRALYSKNADAVSSVLAKYDIKYVIFDGYLRSPGNERSLIPEDTSAMLLSLPDIRKLATFGRLSVYERTDVKTQSFIRTTSALPNVAPAYGFTDNDIAFSTLGDYQTSNISDANIIFPFRSLFTKRSIDEREFTASTTENGIVIAPMDPSLASFSASIDTSAPEYTASVGGSLVPQAVRSCGVLNLGTTQAEIADDTSGSYLKITSINTQGCMSIGAPQLTYTQGYLVSVTWKHASGRPLMFSLINDTDRHVEVETLLTPANTSAVKNSWETSYFVLPPLASDGMGYTIYVTNGSIRTTPSVNDIKSVNFYVLPYQQLITEAITSGSVVTASATNAILRVSHPNPAYYTVLLNNKSAETTLVLSQAYDRGWVAYDVTNVPPLLRFVPFIFGKRINTHIPVNNWENGWKLPNDTLNNHEGRTIVLFFIPQLLEYVGLALLGIIVFGAALGRLSGQSD